jgi:hypothetical protein
MSIGYFLIAQNMYQYIWIDCFNKFPLTTEIYNLFKNNDKKICIVSPELQKKKILKNTEI